MLMAEEQQLVNQRLPLQAEKNRGAGNAQPTNIQSRGPQLAGGKCP